MKKQRITARVTDLVLNEGQIEWLPKNPRQWTQEDIDRTKASLQRDADFQEDRPLLVLKHDDKLLVFAGNLRTTSAKELKWDSLEAVLYTPESDEDCVTIKRRAMLDNGSFGSWDFDALANEWDDLPLVEWGVDVPKWDNINPDDLSDEFSLPSGDKEPFQQMTFTLADFQAQEIKDAIEEAKGLEEYKVMMTFGNSNTNGNALALIIEQWIESRK
jgi:hypothetical protein